MPTYPWEAAVMKAILETDNGKILSRIIAARETIIERLHGASIINGTGPIDSTERAEIENALRKLKILEQERCPN
jgi:hypothetical protein